MQTKSIFYLLKFVSFLGAFLCGASFLAGLIVITLDRRGVKQLNQVKVLTCCFSVYIYVNIKAMDLSVNVSILLKSPLLF